MHKEHILKYLEANGHDGHSSVGKIDILNIHVEKKNVLVNKCGEERKKLNLG